MASETPQFGPADVKQRLEHLRSDRVAMATRLSRARWLPPGIGAVAGAYVAGPLIPNETWRNALLVLTLVATIAMLSAYHRTTGIKPSKVGLRAAMIVAAALGVSLLLLSVSFGLVAGELPWWVTASSAVTFIVVTWLARMFITAASEHISHGI